jgi:hypothetical protein
MWLRPLGTKQVCVCCASPGVFDPPNEPRRGEPRRTPLGVLTPSSAHRSGHPLKDASGRELV